MSGEETKSYNGTNNRTEPVSINKFTTEKQQPCVKFYHTGMGAESYLVCSLSFIPQSQFNPLPSYHEIEETKVCGKTCDCTNFKNSNLGRLLR